MAIVLMLAWRFTAAVTTDYWNVLRTTTIAEEAGNHKKAIPTIFLFLAAAVSAQQEISFYALMWLLTVTHVPMWSI